MYPYNKATYHSFNCNSYKNFFFIKKEMFELQISFLFHYKSKFIYNAIQKTASLQLGINVLVVVLFSNFARLVAYMAWWWLPTDQWCAQSSTNQTCSDQTPVGWDKKIRGKRWSISSWPDSFSMMNQCLHSLMEDTHTLTLLNLQSQKDAVL